MYGHRFKKLVLAVVDYINKEEEKPPQELKLALQCKSWNTLPEPGGLLDQPYGLMERMSTALSVYNTYKEMKKSNNWAEYVKSNPEANEIVEWVNELRRNGST